MVREVLGDLQIPVVLNVRAGHIKDPLTIPMNGLAKIDGARVILSEQRNKWKQKGSRKGKI